MPLTPLTLPSQITLYPTALDATMMFAETQVLTATGFLNNRNAGQLDLGGIASGVSSVGRMEAFWNIDIPLCDFSSGDEKYELMLFGSNDVAFGNGNVELLAYHDLAAASAGRRVPTTLGASPATFPTRLQLPFTNLMQKIMYRFLRANVAIGGTTPSITLTSWISRVEFKI